MTFQATLAGWAATLAVIGGLIAFDLWQSSRKPHAVGLREAAGWSLFYIAVAVLFGVAFSLICRMEPRCAVLRGLHRRAQPVDRQPVRVRDHHEHVRGPRGTAAASADDRHRRRAGASGGVHRARSGAARRLLVHLPRVRRGVSPPPRCNSFATATRTRRSRTTLSSPPPDGVACRRCCSRWSPSPPPTWCSRLTRSRPCSASPSTPTSCSRPTRSRCSVSARCISSSRGCSTGSCTSRPAWP